MPKPKRGAADGAERRDRNSGGGGGGVAAALGAWDADAGGCSAVDAWTLVGADGGPDEFAVMPSVLCFFMKSVKPFSLPVQQKPPRQKAMATMGAVAAAAAAAAIAAAGRQNPEAHPVSPRGETLAAAVDFDGAASGGGGGGGADGGSGVSGDSDGGGGRRRDGRDDRGFPAAMSGALPLLREGFDGPLGRAPSFCTPERDRPRRSGDEEEGGGSGGGLAVANPPRGSWAGFVGGGRCTGAGVGRSKTLPTSPAVSGEKERRADDDDGKKRYRWSQEETAAARKAAGTGDAGGSIEAGGAACGVMLTFDSLERLSAAYQLQRPRLFAVGRPRPDAGVMLEPKALRLPCDDDGLGGAAVAGSGGAAFAGDGGAARGGRGNNDCGGGDGSGGCGLSWLDGGSLLSPVHDLEFMRRAQPAPRHGGSGIFYTQEAMVAGMNEGAGRELAGASGNGGRGGENGGENGGDNDAFSVWEKEEEFGEQPPLPGCPMSMTSLPLFEPSDRGIDASEPHRAGSVTAIEITGTHEQSAWSGAGVVANAAAAVEAASAAAAAAAGNGGPGFQSTGTGADAAPSVAVATVTVPVKTPLEFLDLVLSLHNHNLCQRARSGSGGSRSSDGGGDSGGGGRELVLEVAEERHVIIRPAVGRKHPTASSSSC
ncbi:unnamed protein product [Phaeothamnion confervicola]